MSRLRRLAWLPLLAFGPLSVAALADCKSDSSAPGGSGGAGAGGPCASIGAANEVASTDPAAAGQCIFLYDTWGVEVENEWPPTSFMLGLMTSESAVFGNQYASFGFLPDPHDEFPIGFKRGAVDPTKVHETCALCHTSKLPDGRIWLGSPNLHLDFGAFLIAVNQRWVAAGHAPLASDL